MHGVWYVISSLDAICITDLLSSQAATLLSTGHLVMPPSIRQCHYNVTCHLDSDTLLISASSTAGIHTP